MSEQELLALLLALGRKKIEWETIKAEMAHDGGVLDTARTKTRIVDTRKLRVYTDLQELQREVLERAASYAGAVDGG